MSEASLPQGILKAGTVTISAEQVLVEHFSFDMDNLPPGDACSDVALRWALGRIGPEVTP